MVVHAKLNLVRYPIKVFLIWMLQLGLGFTPGMAGVTESAAYLHHMTINVTVSLLVGHR